jgi:signal transduction histidine kinase
MFLIESQWLVIQAPTWFAWLRVLILTVSFVLLLIFGLRLLQSEKHLSGGYNYRWVVGGLYVLLVFLIGAYNWNSHADRLAHLDASLRYFLAVPASILAGLALQGRATRAQHEANRYLGLSFSWAAVGFLVYAVTQLVVPPVDVYPGNTLNTAAFLEYTGFPVQVVRAATAVLITASLLQSIRVAEAERQKQFLAAQQERLDALEQLRVELIKREAMRQELLRHIVIAQEDERARIARELHDETAQMLTAFTLHLAALHKSIRHSPKIDEQIHYLQSLSRQMSEGIYRLVRDLRPAQLDDLGLVAALQYLVDEVYQRLELQVELQVRGERRRLDPLAETVIFRVAQEALTNVARHAEVLTARIDLWFETDRVTLRITDQGIGFNPQSLPDSGSGWGLAGMQERAESIGGKLTLRSTPGSGTMVQIVVPVKARNAKAHQDLYRDTQSEEAVWRPSA